MKKTISIITILILIFSLSVSVFAFTENPPIEVETEQETSQEETTVETTVETADTIDTTEEQAIITNEITSADSRSNETYQTTNPDENALLINTAENVEINNPTVLKAGNSNNHEDCSFYGVNSAVLVKGGTKTTINGGKITSSAVGGNAAFCYGDKTTLTISGTKIKTTEDGSGGIMAAGGGTVYANNLEVETSGNSSAPIRSDRGGGKMVVDGGTYISNGLGSPAIYSTADITVKNANLTSNLSEGVCIEGKNSVTLKDTNLTANNTKTNGNATFLDSVMLYQSMSGDANKGTAKFTMNGGTLTNRRGHVFHVTNTKAIINLTDVNIVNEDRDNILISVCDDGWNGSPNNATLIANSQFLYGGILVAKNSSLNLTLKQGTVFEGYIDGNIVDASGKTVSSEAGDVTLTLEGGKMVLTKDTYVSTFIGSTSDVTFNGYTLYVNGDALSEEDAEIEETTEEEEETVVDETTEEEEEVTEVEETTEVTPENVKRDTKFLVILAAVTLCLLVILVIAIKKSNAKLEENKEEDDSLEENDDDILNQ